MLTINLPLVAKERKRNDELQEAWQSLVKVRFSQIKSIFPLPGKKGKVGHRSGDNQEAAAGKPTQ